MDGDSPGWGADFTRRPGDQRPVVGRGVMTRGDTYNLIDSAAPDTCFQNTLSPLTATAGPFPGPNTRQTAIICQIPSIITSPDNSSVDPVTGKTIGTGSKLITNFFWNLSPAIAQLAASAGSLAYVNVGILTQQYDPTTVTWNSIQASIPDSAAYNVFSVGNAAPVVNWLSDVPFLTGFGGFAASRITAGYGIFIRAGMNGNAGAGPYSITIPVDGCFVWK